MKNIACFPILVFLVSLSVQAGQQGESRVPDLNNLADQLQLDATQTSQLTDLVKQHRKQMQSLRDDTQQSREQMHELRDRHREELLTVLSYEQLYHFDQYMRQFHRRHKPGEQAGQ